jgi:hypothetical protein
LWLFGAEFELRAWVLSGGVARGDELEAMGRVEGIWLKVRGVCWKVVDRLGICVKCEGDGADISSRRSDDEIRLAVQDLLSASTWCYDR